MATKSITIDLEAYERLKAHKRETESFSQVIKRLVSPPFDLDEYFRQIEADPMSQEAVEAVEEHIRFRHIPSERDR
jgi:predicted CopG family antitoxin